MLNHYKATAQVYNQLGKNYLDSIYKIFPVERAAFVRLFKPGSTILDVGCAGGRDSKLFAQKGFNVVGIDFSDVFIKEAKRLVPQAKFYKADIRKIRFPQKSFNAIWAYAVLLHLNRKDIPLVLKEFYRILKPGGVLHIGTKEGVGSGIVREKISGGKERIFIYFKKTELEDLVTAASFKIVRSKRVRDGLKRKGVSWLSIQARKVL